MEWWLKAAVTALTVAVVMGASRLVGQRLAGLLASLPTVSAPTLVWLVQERGVAFTVHVTVGSISACAMLAAFALAYALVAQRSSVLVALVTGLLGALALAVPALRTSDHLGPATLFALLACGVAMTAMPVLHGHTVRGRSSVGQAGCTALGAGAMSLLAVTVGPALGSFATGLLSSLPTVSAAVAISEHAAGGCRAVTEFLRGFVIGLFGKIAFFAAFVLWAEPLGTAWALTLGCMAAGAATAAAAHLHHQLRPRRLVPGAVSEASPS